MLEAIKRGRDVSRPMESYVPKEGEFSLKELSSVKPDFWALPSQKYKTPKPSFLVLNDYIAILSRGERALFSYEILSAYTLFNLQLKQYASNLRILGYSNTCDKLLKEVEHSLSYSESVSGYKKSIDFDYKSVINTFEKENKTKCPNERLMTVEAFVNDIEIFVDSLPFLKSRSYTAAYSVYKRLIKLSTY